MRVWGWVVLVMWLPGRILAAPEPPPPGDYPGAQYIDRTGCVFLREGTEWMPRLDGQGQPVCGFPPSKPAEPDLAAAPPPSVEEVLTDALAEGLKPGDLLTDKPAEPLREVAPDPAQAALVETLAREAALDRRLRDITAPSAPVGLCARLGYRPATAADQQPGNDVTQGLCPGMVADPKPVLAQSTVQPAADADRAPQPDTAPVPQDATPPKSAVQPAPTRSAKPQAPAVPSRPSSVVARRDAPGRTGPNRTASPGAVEMIPAHARYVQIGVYADEGNALAALRGLSVMGYRTAQRSERIGDGIAKAILAGPFTDRQALVRALTLLRSSGYPRASAR
ncbi:SPOR domain-containing protein [Paracoccus subflavus]|nr:SPOR domain-containing protein [Paracoccus subflavus]